MDWSSSAGRPRAGVPHKRVHVRGVRACPELVERPRFRDLGSHGPEMSSRIQMAWITSLPSTPKCRGQQVLVIRVDDTESGFRWGREMNGIGSAQKDRCRQLPIYVTNP
jgi:hypothetical protein